MKLLSCYLPPDIVKHKYINSYHWISRCAVVITVLWLFNFVFAGLNFSVTANAAHTRYAHGCAAILTPPRAQGAGAIKAHIGKFVGMDACAEKTLHAGQALTVPCRRKVGVDGRERKPVSEKYRAVKQKLKTFWPGTGCEHATGRTDELRWPLH